MIKVQNSVPSVYYDSSRDFQLIGHLFDLVLNAIKTDADMVFNLPLSVNSADQLLDLMAFTFGLRLDKTKYTAQQLRAVCSVAPKMMRTKGSIAAVDTLCTALMRADAVSGTFYREISPDHTTLTIYISQAAACKDILYELLPYIIPAGMIFNIKQARTSSAETIDSFGLTDTVHYNLVKPTPYILANITDQADQYLTPDLFTDNTENGSSDTTLGFPRGLINQTTLVDKVRAKDLTDNAWDWINEYQEEN